MGKPDKEDLKDGTALLQITSNTKAGPVQGLYWVHNKGEISHLLKFKGKEVYTVEKDRCDCPDGHKGNTCKHVRSLQVALPKVE